jgi:BioD-like phosphotransacetylase family protein
MLKLPKEEAAKQFDEIAKTNPELAKKIIKAAEDEKLGITPNNESLKAKGVANGDRAIAIAKEFKKLKTNEEKSKLWQEYVTKKIINTEVAKQLLEMKKRGEF